MENEDFADTLCKFCKYSPKKYSCPRCNANYCSVTCYQSKTHLECTEFFYKDCVLEQLSSTSNNADEQKRITEVLQRVSETHQLQPKEDDSMDSDDEECLSLSERLAGIDLDDSKKVWEKLTTDERQEFEAFLKSNDVSKLIPKWKPWWEWCSNKKVQEMEDVLKYKENCPEIKSNIKDFSAITNKQPADCVTYNLVNIIGAYAFTARYFNGDHSEFIDETVDYILTLSLCLKTGENFDSMGEAIDSVLHECLVNDINVDAENMKLLKEDTKMILRGPCKSDDKYYILCALSDIHKLIGSVLSKRTLLNASSLANGDISLKQFKLCMKKIEYYLSYTICYFNQKNYA